MNQSEKKLVNTCEECSQPGIYQYLNIISYCKKHFTQFISTNAKAAAQI